MTASSEPRRQPRGSAFKALLQLLAMLLVAVLALQVYFIARVVLMRWVNPGSTTFQRTQAVSILSRQGRLPWSQEWRSLREMGSAMPRAVIASEDAGFLSHSGVDWEAVQKAWQTNQERANTPIRRGRPKVVGGSTISQQLAKNLFLSGERQFVRKAQEALITLVLEACLGKARILEIYLNNVEWGEGVFGAPAAAQHYFRVYPAHLSGLQAAQLAVMLPAPRRFERNPHSAYVQGRAQTIAARMASVAWPQQP